MTMDNYILTVPHKCGSFILKQILISLSSSYKEDVYYTETEQCSKQITFTRVVRRDKVYCNMFNTGGNLVFLVRNPAAICISEYYSFGYTHAQPPDMSDTEFRKMRENIRNISLEEYVNKQIMYHSRRIGWILDASKCCKTIIPYELMISDFEKFLEVLLGSLGLESMYSIIYKKWYKAFQLIEDQSDNITNHKLKTHKRTTDINEWKKKLSEKSITEYYKRVPNNVFQKYDNLLLSYNIE